MQIQIEAVHFKASNDLLELINTKIKHLSHYDDQLIKLHVYLHLERDANSKSKIKKKMVEMKAHQKGKDFFVKKSAKTFEIAISKCVATLKIILIKDNQKRKNKKRNIIKKVFRFFRP